MLTHGIPGAAKSFATFDVGRTTVDVTVPFLWAAFNAIYFVLLEPAAGVSARERHFISRVRLIASFGCRQLLYAPILLSLGHLSNIAYSEHHDAAIKYAGIAFVASWIAQFVGHGKVRALWHSLPRINTTLIHACF